MNNLEVTTSKGSVENFDGTISAILKRRADLAEKISVVSSLMKNNQEALRFFSKSEVYLNFDFDNEALAQNKADVEFWRELISIGDIKNSMPSCKKEEWDSSINKGDVPPFTPEFVLPTIKDILVNQKNYLADRVCSVFHGLSDVHITNCPQGFGKRVILKGVVKFLSANSTTPSDVKHEKIDDLRVVASIMLGRERVNISKSNTKNIIENICSKNKIGEWVSIDGNSLLIKVFKVGTVHIEIHPDLISKLNDVLATKYPLAIPNKFREVKRSYSKQKEFQLPIEDKCLSINTMVALSKFKKVWLMETHNSYLREYTDQIFLYDFEKSEQVSDVLKMLGGEVVVENYWTFENPKVLDSLPDIIMNGSIPNKKDFQFYPTKGDVGGVAASLLRDNMNDEDGLVLEPNIGQGDLADQFGGGNIIGVELSSFQSAVAKAKGYEVETCDFLEWAAKEKRKFKGVLMNPPYSNQQVYTHAKAAYKLLNNDGGVMSMVVPTAFDVDELDVGSDFSWFETGDYKEQFDKTEISVKVVVIIKQVG